MTGFMRVVVRLASSLLASLFLSCTVMVFMNVFDWQFSFFLCPGMIDVMMVGSLSSWSRVGPHLSCGDVFL